MPSRVGLQPPGGRGEMSSDRSPPGGRSPVVTSQPRVPRSPRRGPGVPRPASCGAGRVRRSPPRRGGRHANTSDTHVVRAPSRRLIHNHRGHAAKCRPAAPTPGGRPNAVQADGSRSARPYGQQVPSLRGMVRRWGQVCRSFPRRVGYPLGGRPPASGTRLARFVAIRRPIIPTPGGRAAQRAHG